MNKTINQIKQYVFENVIGVTFVDKQKGTNNWFIVVTGISIEEAAIELRELGFKIVAINLKNKTIFAEFKGLGSTYYAKQIKVYS